ncbi:MAG: helix-turn-helix transcriptional regulator [Methylobacter sp.]
MNTILPKKGNVHKKIPEIERFRLFLKSSRVKTSDIAKETDSSERTINNYIWKNLPLGGQLLRHLCTRYNVSIDWLLTGRGSMLLDEVNEQASVYVVSDVNPRAMRICSFVQEFMQSASDDERAWLEMQVKLHVPQYVEFLKRHHHE